MTRAWSPPLLLLVAFLVVWPVAGFPWWPLVVVGLSVLGRLLGFGPLIRRPQNAAVLAGLLIVSALH